MKIDFRHHLRKPLEERFWSKVSKTRGCWIWNGAKCNDYGLIQVANKSTRRGWKLERAHRVSWLLHFGKVPKGKLVLHECDNPSCVRPSHLWLGNHYDNNHDMIDKGRSVSLIGESHPMTKLNPKVVVEIRSRREKGETYQAIADSVGVCRANVQFVCKRVTWRHVK